MNSIFYGYERSDGKYGIRNHIALIPTVGCANEVAEAISDQVNGTAPLLHHQGCCQLAPDLEIVSRTLIGFGKNPNVSSTLIVSLGCESTSANMIADKIVQTGKHVEVINIQDLGGFNASVEKGIKLAKKMVEEDSSLKKKRADIDELTVGLKCGASDATSGLVSNPVVGLCTDFLVNNNATVITAETTEIMGAEHIFASRAISNDVANKICTIVESVELKTKSVGVDMRGSQPTPGNIAGGITTIEEKSLGAICKAGTSPIKSVLEYGEPPNENGLHLMDTPGSEMHVLPALAAAGAQLILFTTGRGAPQGFPIVPVIKICGNSTTCSKMSEHIDLDVSGVLSGKENLEATFEKLMKLIFLVASKKLTKSEISGYTKTMEIYTHGLTI